MKQETARINVHFPLDQASWLRRRATQLRTNVSTLIRQAVDELKKSHRQSSKGGHAMIRCIAWSLAINLFLASFILYLANMTPCIYTVLEKCWR